MADRPSQRVTKKSPGAEPFSRRLRQRFGARCLQVGAKNHPALRVAPLMESIPILVPERGILDRTLQDDQSDKDNGEGGDYDVGDHGGRGSDYRWGSSRIVGCFARTNLLRFARMRMR